MSGVSGFQPAKARLRRQGSRRDSEYRRQYLQRTSRRRNGPDTLRTIRKDRAETTVREHQPQRYLDVDKHPARQSYSCVENLDALAGVFVGAVSDNFGEEIEQKIFHARIVVDNDAVKQEMAEYKPIPAISSFLDASGRNIMQEKIKENYRRIKQDALDIIEAEMKRIEKDEKLAEKLL